MTEATTPRLKLVEEPSIEFQIKLDKEAAVEDGRAHVVVPTTTKTTVEVFYVRLLDLKGFKAPAGQQFKKRADGPKLSERDQKEFEFELEENQVKISNLS